MAVVSTAVNVNLGGGSPPGCRALLEMLRQYCPRTVQPGHEPSRILVDKYLLGPKQAAYSALS
jgi:hypothetical protein